MHFIYLLLRYVLELILYLTFAQESSIDMYLQVFDKYFSMDEIKKSTKIKYFTICKFSEPSTVNLETV